MADPLTIACPKCGETIEVEFRHREPEPSEIDKLLDRIDALETALANKGTNDGTGNGGSSAQDAEEDDAGSATDDADDADDI